uniref:Amino acid transporter transmembrane domain-containing protein n=1 Tax=Esox lucius TaxID=8010 RepID=A0AAY5KIM4_ESOLU
MHVNAVLRRNSHLSIPLDFKVNVLKADLLQQPFSVCSRFDDPDGIGECEEFLPHGDGKKPLRFTDFEGKTSFGMSVFNLGNAIMGSGILGLAYAMANTGILLFLFLLTAVAALSSYSIHLLLKSSGIVGIRAYEQLGYRAFGTPGKMAAGIAITLQNIGGEGVSVLCGVEPFILFPIPDDIYQVLIHLWYLNGNYLVVIVSVSVILPLTAYTIPILAFAFVCHPEVLPIYTELRNPTQKRMQHVSNLSILVMYTMYFLAALFGYLTFYGKTESELLHTYSKIDPYDTLILCVRLAVLTAVTLTVPIVLFPVRRALNQMFFSSKSFNWIRHVAIALALLSFINMLVIFAPNILGIFGIIGATSAPCLIFIFPAVFYIRIVPKEQEPMRSSPKILAACFAGLGVVFMIMSLSFIIIDWTMGSSNSGGGH